MKSRRIEYLPSVEYKYYIFCEGTQTEPQYFEGFKKAIESNPIYKNMVITMIDYLICYLNTAIRSKQLVGRN